MKFYLLTFFLACQLSSIACADPFTCDPQVARAITSTLCSFRDQSYKTQDVTQIKMTPGEFQGQFIKQENVNVIIYGSCELNSIPSAIFTSFGPITRLQFNDGQLNKIEFEDFEFGKDLKYIELIGVKIGTIGSKAFTSLRNLEEMLIRDCDIDSLADDATFEMKGLKKFVFENNNVKVHT